jgi:outer membrane protein
MYWDLVYAYENVRVQQESLTYAQKALDDSRRQAQVGTVPPIQVVSSQSTVSTDQQNLILAQNNLQLQKLLMKNALSRSIEDPVLAEADVIPTSTMQVPQERSGHSYAGSDQSGSRPSRGTGGVAHRSEFPRPEQQSRTQRHAAHARCFRLLRRIRRGREYQSRSACTTLPAVSTDCLQPGSNAPPPFQNGGSVGYGGTLNQLVNGTAPDKGVGLSLNHSAAQSRSAGQPGARGTGIPPGPGALHQLENQVRIEVRNAQFDVKQNRASVQAAQYAVDFARQTLDADQQKLKVGLTTTTAILQDASTLTTSESNLVSAKAAYEKSRIELDRATGLLLDHAGIDVADATRGQVTHQPQVPYVAPRQDASPTGQAAPAQAPSSQPPPS